MTGPHIAVVPVRSFTTAKERLRPVISDDDRRLLVRRMAERVVEVVGAMMPVLVVSKDPDVLAWAASVGAEPIPEAADAVVGVAGHVRRHIIESLLDEDLNAAVTAGADAATDIGGRTLVVVAGDLPLLTHEDIAALLRLPSRPGVTLAADKHGFGTNALALAPPGALRFRFGADSLVQHRLAAFMSGLPVRVVRRVGLEMDIDTPEDLRVLEASTGERRLV